MARLTDPERLEKFQKVLREWRVSGSISCTPEADKWLRRNLEKCTQVTLNKLMHDYVLLENGEIDEVVEQRERWKDEWEFHHDLRIPFRGKLLYLETRLCYDPFDPRVEPSIFVVNLHWT